MSNIGGLTYFKAISRLMDKYPGAPGTDFSIFDCVNDNLVEEEESTPSQVYVTIGHMLRQTAHRYGFHYLATAVHYQEWYIYVRTSDAAVAAYVRYIRYDGGATVLGEDSTNNTAWVYFWLLVSPPYDVTYTYYFQLRTNGVAVAYARQGWIVAATFSGHEWYILR